MGGGGLFSEKGSPLNQHGKQKVSTVLLNLKLNTGQKPCLEEDCEKSWKVQPLNRHCGNCVLPRGTMNVLI